MKGANSLEGQLQIFLVWRDMKIFSSVVLFFFFLRKMMKSSCIFLDLTFRSQFCKFKIRVYHHFNILHSKMFLNVKHI
jgi:hypothetical protein